MDYPGDSVMEREPTLVDLSRAKNGIWFRRFLAEIFFVKCRQKKIVLFAVFTCELSLAALNMWFGEGNWLP